MQRLYCYVDESGQDTKSEVFIVVAVISDKEQYMLRQKLSEIENMAKTGHRKWHKSRSERRMKYLRLVLNQKIGKGDVYVGHFKKPLPYFLPMLEVLEKSIKKKVKEKYRATVYIDGIDRKKAAELTNALRLRGISLEFVKSRKDESEPVIRLADMWSGCIRGAMLGKKEESAIFKEAKEIQYLEDITK